MRAETASASGMASRVTIGVERSLVTFAWRPPSTGAPQSYRLDVGTAPGLANLATVAINGQATSLPLTAPPGRFWARLHAISDSSASLPTPELYVAATATDVFKCNLYVSPPQTF